MEKFPCQLVQTMDCLHNTFSKPTQVDLLCSSIMIA